MYSRTRCTAASNSGREKSERGALVAPGWATGAARDAPAKRVLVRALKTGKAPLQLLPALILHPREGAKHTDEAEAILRGEAALGWS